MKHFSCALLAATAVSFTACKPTIEGSSTASKGSADFTRYVAIGNSLTAGYADGSFYRSGQINSYPNMLAGQFKLVGGGEFKQPLLVSDNGWPGPKRVLGYSTGCDSNTSLTPVPAPDWLANKTADSIANIANISEQGPFNNLGVPGIRATDYLLAGYAAGVQILAKIGYSFRMYPNPYTDRPIDIAAKSGHTFFTMWLGSNDVLSYATNGGEGKASGYGPNDISTLDSFQHCYKAVVDTMTAKGQKGVLINIPDVTSVPFFTTVPPKGLKLDTPQAAGLNLAYTGTGITFSAGYNAFIIEDGSAPAGLRPIKEGEYLLLTLPQDSLKCGGWGSRKPIPRKYVLDATEVANVRSATMAFNSYIAQMASEKGLGYVDMNTYLKSFQTGITYNALTFTTTFVSGGAFSLDGVHLTPRGYALAANKIIGVINAKYGSTIPQVDVSKYNGVLFP